MFPFFIAITICFMRNENILKKSYRHLSRLVHKNNCTPLTTKVNKYARWGSVVVKKCIAHFRTVKLLFL